MAKIIKFALELKNGESVRTIEDLRQHFDLEKVVAYFMNGRLLTWLRHRHLDEEAAALESLSAEDTEFAKKLCDILGVAYDEHQEKANAIDTNALMVDHERLNRLRQVTSDSEILAKIDRVAFDEKDLQRLAFDNESDVYLCSGRFVIPLNVENKHYIGLGKAEAVIVSDEWIEFDVKGIRFTNVSFDAEYQLIADRIQEWFEKGSTANQYKEAAVWYKKAADAGHSGAMTELGTMYLYGNGVEQDDVKAKLLFEKAVNMGNADAMAYIGEMYLFGNGVSVDYGQALKWHQKAADAGSAMAMWRIGEAYHRGRCVAQDAKKAIEWYKKAADKGYTQGMTNLGDIYREVIKDYEKAMEWYKRAGEAGDHWGFINIGSMYEWRDGIDHNNEKAIEWYKKAAEMGDSYSMMLIGNIYRDGMGIAQDYKEAFKWYQKSATRYRYESESMVQLGLLYWKGHGVEKDHAKANEWFKKAANAGNYNGMYNLATSYFDGDGIAQDNQQARLWMQKIADEGYGDKCEEAKKWLEEH